MARIVRAYSASDAYIKTLNEVMDNWVHKTSPRGLKTLEVPNFIIEVQDPSFRPIETRCAERNKKIAAYTKGEFELYESGTNKAADFAKLSKFWNGIKNADGTVNSAYGYLIYKNKSCGEGVTPWEFCKDELVRDSASRRAVLYFSTPQHLKRNTADQPCTLHGYFSIREHLNEYGKKENQLDFTVCMRSNDVFFGLVYDMPWFIWLLHRMVRELNYDHKSDLRLGTYTHIAHSMHAYEKNIDEINKMRGKGI